MRLVRAVFYFEVITNFGSAVFAILFPVAFLGQFGPSSLPLVAVEFGRWYAVLLVVLSLVLFAALREGTDTLLRPVIRAYLVGDILQITVAARLGYASGFFSAAAHAAIWTSVFYALFRLVYLRLSAPA